jgi:hypothetical protein
MNQKLSDWASIAEIVSGVAVVVTLVFLIRGIDENTELTRAALYASHINAFNEQSRDAYSDPEVARIFRAWLVEDFSSLSESDNARLEQMVAYFFRSYEGAFLAHQSGLYGEFEWERMERSTCDNYGRAIAGGFAYLLDALMTRPFLDFMEHNCPSRDE